jgi:omega-amidase
MSSDPTRPIRVALVQLGNITSDKDKNILHAHEMIKKAASGGDGAKPDIIILPV